MIKDINHVGVVVIGRNEGERLKTCLLSVRSQVDKIIYVDSDSSDGSVEFAESQGVKVIQLDMSIPFSAGRARNEGVDCLTRVYPDIKYVQFIDGDCELLDGWLNVALKYLIENRSYAIVAGLRIERYPEQTIYNRLCALEWDTPIGETKACGGDFLIRLRAFNKVEGFNPMVIAGEEPELCYRLRKKGEKIYRLKCDMTKHDASIIRFGQWWKRAVRSGYAFAQGVALHGLGGEWYCVRDSLRIWFWALVFPISILVCWLLFNSGWLLLFAAYPVHLLKVAYTSKRCDSRKNALAYAFFNLIGKWPQLTGQILFLVRKILGKESLIIEYKNSNGE